MQTSMSGPRMADRRVLIAALVLGAIAAGLAVAFLASAGESSGGPPVATTRSVVVATQDIAVGTVIEEGMVEVRDLPIEAVVTDASTDLDAVVGETARYPVSEGEQVNAVRLVAPTEVQALSFQIPEGMRGFTIPVNVNESPAALLAPGDFVDVLVAGEVSALITPENVLTGDSVAVQAPAPEVTDELKAVVTLLQNVQVLSVQRDYVEEGGVYEPSTRGAPPEEEGVSYVTLSLTPEQSQLLWLASQEGELTLTLRAFGDDAVAPIGPVAEPVRVGP